MKRFFVLLIGLACAAAQAQQAPCLKLHSAKLKDHVLRQGSTAVMELVFLSRGCYVFNGSPANRVWPALEIASEPGLTSRARGAGAANFDESTLAFGLLRAQEVRLDVDLQASPDLRVGEHKLTGVLHYQVIDERGNLSDQTLDLEKTFKVDVPKAPEGLMPPGPGFSDRHPVWAKVLLPFEIIALFPLWILAGLISGESC